jgi:F-type H+-transporting ATPase subunit delta
MAALSRRQLASYAAGQLLDGRGPRSLSKELAAVLVNSKRTNQAELLADDIAYELETSGRVANATVTSAHAIGEQLARQISGFIKKSAGVQDVIISEQIDESLIGGVRIDTAAHSWDKTLRRKLTEVQEVV